MSEQYLNHLHSGAKKLLEIASENDKSKKVFDNKALSNGLNALSRLHELAKQRKAMTIIDWLGLPHKTENLHFLNFSAAFIKDIHKPGPREARLEITDYDHFVLMAAAETLSEIMWENKSDPEIPGPVFQDCIDDYGFQDLKIILQVFVKNYIGNVLQHLFEAGKVRMANPKLPPETEMELKEKEAASIAAYAFYNLDLAGKPDPDSKKILEKLHLAQYLILSKS